MDLTSLNQRSAPRPYDNPHVETRVAFDENNRPVYVAVPVAPTSDRAMVHVPTSEYREPVVYQPVQYAAQSAPETYSPLHDPWVARLLAGGVAVTGTCFGLSFLLAALAAAETALGFLLGIIVVVWLVMVASKSGGSGSTVNITNSNRSKHRG